MFININTIWFERMAFILALFVFVSPSYAVTLKRESILNSGKITVSDIFEGTGDVGHRVIGKSPLPGQNMTLNSRTLMKIAMALDLNWRPQSTGETSTLKRVATVITQDQIESTLTEEIDVDGHFNLIFDNPDQDITLPQGTHQTLEYDDVKYNPLTNRFTAKVYAPSKDNPVHQETVTGRVERMIDLPVLQTTLRNGDVIGERDIMTISVPANSVNDSAIINTTNIVGMTPRRTIQQGKMIKTVDVIKPEAVSRGNLVTMIFKSGTLQLTAEGKALQNGAEGDTIRVLNTASKKTVQALITNTNEVTVKTF